MLKKLAVSPFAWLCGEELSLSYSFGETLRCVTLLTFVSACGQALTSYGMLTVAMQGQNKSVLKGNQ